MASRSSISSLSRALSRHILSSSPRSSTLPPLAFTCFYTSSTSTSDLELGSEPNHEVDLDETESAPGQTQQQTQQQQRLNFQRPLENGLDQGVYKAILVGRVGQNPVQKRLKGGRLVTLFSLGTGGIRNNRRPLEDEDPREYANRCTVQWHRVSVYPERLGALAKKHVKPGSVVYLEGNLETKIFSDPISGLVRRIREIAIRRDGRLLFLSKGGDDQSEADLKGVGYF